MHVTLVSSGKIDELRTHILMVIQKTDQYVRTWTADNNGRCSEVYRVYCMEYDSGIGLSLFDILFMILNWVHCALPHVLSPKPSTKVQVLIFAQMSTCTGDE